MQRQNYMITAEEVAESMGISLGYAYKLLRKLNKELADQGYVTVAGKIPVSYTHLDVYKRQGYPLPYHPWYSRYRRCC